MRCYTFAGTTVAVRTGKGLGAVKSIVTDHNGTPLAYVDNTNGLSLTQGSSDRGNLPFCGDNRMATVAAVDCQLDMRPETQVRKWAEISLGLIPWVGLAVRAARMAGAGPLLVRAPISTRYGPLNPGPLSDQVARTFRSSSYSEVVLTEEVTLYRIYGGRSPQLAPWWSRTRPSGPLQAQLDSALNPAWGNAMTDVATIRVPAGTTIYEGFAAPQALKGGGSLMGGGSQVYIEYVDPGWLVP